jgi:ferritin-like protein
MAEISGGNRMAPEDVLPWTQIITMADHYSKRQEMTWHDQLILLLHLGATFEHALMVQYLYAAYSLGGPQVTVEQRPKIKEWQESILAVAREEMGHLLTVQNVLTFLGAGFSISRERFPWAIEWFDIEPFTMGSLACYVNAEMPEIDPFKERKEIETLVKQHLKKDALPVHPVAEVYREIIRLLADKDLIPDSALQPDTYSLQASWDEWGRGYKPAPRALDAAGNLTKITVEMDDQAQFESNVLIFQVATRTDAVAALEAVSLQGEGVEDSKKAGEWSHFRRFIKIFQEFQDIQKELGSDWNPAVSTPVNPNTNPDPLAPDRDGYISCERTRNWAVLLNVRYRMLFQYLAHTFQIGRPSALDEPNLRAMVMHRVFGEMYQLKALSGRIFQMPLRDIDADPKTPPSDRRYAGPPFELPWNLRIPVAEVDCWCMHCDSLVASKEACDAILRSKPTEEEREYIKTLLALDEQTDKWIAQVLAGLNSTMRYSE